MRGATRGSCRTTAPRACCAKTISARAIYYFRYDRGVTNVWPVIGSSAALRLARRFHGALSMEHPIVNLDVFVPFSRSAAFLDWYRGAFGFYPLWCVPYRRVRDYEWIAPRIFDGLGDRLFLDFAIYGMRQPAGANCHRLMERKLLEIGGLKTLISHNYFSPDEFWRIWNRDNYAAAKARADPHNRFRDLYDLTCRAAMGVRAARSAPGGAPI